MILTAQITDVKTRCLARNRLSTSVGTSHQRECILFWLKQVWQRLPFFLWNRVLPERWEVCELFWGRGWRNWSLESNFPYLRS